MPSFTLYNINGENIGTVEQPALFQTPVDEKLIHRYFTWVRSMLRTTLAHTKTRGEVRGGGRKPWKQKGTGRARVGSSRSPLWRTGGTVFGPRKEQTWATRMPRSERRKALFSALSAKAAHGSIIILDAWNLEAPKTKAVVTTLSKLPKADGKVLHISAELDTNLFKSTSNLPNINSRTLSGFSIIDVLNNDVIVMTKETLEKFENHFTPAV